MINYLATLWISYHIFRNRKLTVSTLFNLPKTFLNCLNFFTVKQVQSCPSTVYIPEIPERYLLSSMRTTVLIRIIHFLNSRTFEMQITHRRGQLNFELIISLPMKAAGRYSHFQLGKVYSRVICHGMLMIGRSDQSIYQINEAVLY